MLRNLFLASALAWALLAGCSRSGTQGTPSQPKVADLGAVELTYDTPSRHDLGDGTVCVLTARALTVNNCELLASLEKSGKQVAASRVGMAPIDLPMTLALGNMAIKLRLQPK